MYLGWCSFSFYLLFWTQAFPEGMGMNRTHGSHARCHPYPIPQPVEVGHTTRFYVPYSFRTVVWVLLHPTWTDHWKCCDTRPTVFRPRPRRLESLTICRCHYKGSTFFSVILRPWELVRLVRCSPRWANQVAVEAFVVHWTVYLMGNIWHIEQCIYYFSTSS